MRYFLTSPTHFSIQQNRCSIICLEIIENHNNYLVCLECLHFFRYRIESEFPMLSIHESLNRDLDIHFMKATSITSVSSLNYIENLEN